MKFYDVYYQLRDDKDSEIKVRTFVARNKQSAGEMALGTIGIMYVIVNIVVAK